MANVWLFMTLCCNVCWNVAPMLQDSALQETFRPTLKGRPIAAVMMTSLDIIQCMGIMARLLTVSDALT